MESSLIKEKNKKYPCLMSWDDLVLIMSNKTQGTVLHQGSSLHEVGERLDDCNSHGLVYTGKILLKG